MIDRTRLKTMIAWAIHNYAQSRITDLSHQDNPDQSAVDTLEEMIRNADKIAGYALMGIFSSNVHHSYTVFANEESKT